MVSDIGAAGASAIIRATQTKPGEFKLKNDAAANIKASIDRLEYEAGRKQMLASALRRLQGIADGTIQPSPDREWETVGGFLQTTGQPFKLTLDDRGSIVVEAQIESELTEFAETQRGPLREAVGQLKDIVAEADLEDTKAEFRAQLSFGLLRIAEMTKNYSPPEEAWEKQYLRIAERGDPVKLALDADGNLLALDQIKHDFADVEDEDDRLKLVAARNELENILSGAKVATESWHYEALGHKADGTAYFLGLDESGNIDIQKNSLDNNMPEFLTEDSDGPEVTAEWQEEALSLYSQKKSFHLDFDPSGNIKVVENDYNNVVLGIGSSTGQDPAQQALVSMLA